MIVDTVEVCDDIVMSVIDESSVECNIFHIVHAIAVLKVNNECIKR